MILNQFREFLFIFLNTLTIVTISNLIPIIIILSVFIIDKKTKRPVKIIIDKLSDGSQVFKCGYCGSTNSFLIPFLGANLFQCPHCKRYNILEEQLNNV